MCGAGKGTAPTYRAYWSQEHTPLAEYEDQEVARREIGDYIDYSVTERKHSALD